jgi:serine/threonine protein kinase
MSQPIVSIKPGDPASPSSALSPGAPPAVARSPAAVAPRWAMNRRVPGTAYRLVRPLGAGGMGEVFEVDDERTGRRLALKAVHPAFGFREDLAQRFRDEARVLGQLHAHPNLVEVVHAGETADGRSYLVMELLEGRSLDQELAAQRTTPMPSAVLVPWACAVVGQVLAALAAAHEIGVYHRDVKPSNVFLQSNGGVKLIDFGLAGFVAPRAGVEFETQPGNAAGTPGYIPPERLRGGAADARTDVFAAGVLLWEMLTGERVTDPSDPRAASAQMLARGVPLLGARPELGLPPSLVRLVDRATAYDPGNRFPSIAAFASVLRSVARGLDAPANPGPLASFALPPGPTVNTRRSRAITRKVRFGVPTPPPSSPRARSPAPFGVIDLPRDRRGPSPSRRGALALTSFGRGVRPAFDVLAAHQPAGVRLAPNLKAGRSASGLLAPRVAATLKALEAWQRRQLLSPGRLVHWLLTLWLLAYVIGEQVARWWLARP